MIVEFFGIFVAWAMLSLFSGAATVFAFVLVDIIVQDKWSDDPQGSGWPYLGMILSPVVTIAVAYLTWPF